MFKDGGVSFQTLARKYVTRARKLSLVHEAVTENSFKELKIEETKCRDRSGASTEYKH